MALREGELTSITNYNYNMRQSMQDKLFFLGKIDPDVIVDYGCADGSLFQVLSQDLPGVGLVGYDLEPKMIERAKAKKIKNSAFTTDWSQIERVLGRFKRPAVILSSVIHEVYAYADDLDVITEFWQRVFTFDYVVIRDMMIAESADRPADLEDVAKVRDASDPKYLDDFEKHWGTIEEQPNLLHYLLKYKYLENWDREVEENYLPIFREELYDMIPGNYSIIYRDHFALPYTVNQIKTDFGIDIRDDTHIKLILKKN